MQQNQLIGSQNNVGDLQHLQKLLGPQNNLQNLHQQQQLMAQQNNLSASLDSTGQTGHADGADWQEEVYQKNESLPQPPKPEQVEKLKVFNAMLERIITFLQAPKHTIPPYFKEKLGSYEKQIINFINSNRPREPPSQQLGGPGQILPTQMHSIQQSQSQITQIQSHENPINPQAQSVNLQGSAATMQQSSIASLQHSSLSQQNMMNLPQPGSKLDSAGQGYALISMQWVPVGSLCQKSVHSPRQASENALQNLVLKLILILLLVIILFQLVPLLQTGESTYSMAQFLP
ncbi:mediator of RNA polymerase II transcription subunit 15a-like [Tripterygium wilfordii]|uniref:Mediator of RNA polymerase II transcription subunit 15a-like n=1 Tax=Tripterygium wilfordii TaxID=458696 RepID=A0A7J7CYB0_TRIWF|nr:mediator of RNA polymerase II transcription subunit 15a-like [Tripterygium wilfordii]